MPQHPDQPGPSRPRMGDTRPEASIREEPQAAQDTNTTAGEGKKKKKHRAGKKRKNRRQSFVATSDLSGVNSDPERTQHVEQTGESCRRPGELL